MKRRRNDDERQMWIDNEEGLYGWWKSTGQSMRVFIRENRKQLDAVIDRALSAEPAPGP